MAYNPNARRGVNRQTQARRNASKSIALPATQKPPRDHSIDHNGITPYLMRFIAWGNVTGLSEQTSAIRERGVRRFIVWCDERSIDNPNDITRAVLESYQKHLHYYRKANGEPMSISSQKTLLSSLTAFCKWLAKERYVAFNPAAELELPRAVRNLPKVILSLDEIEKIIGLVDTTTAYGVRDRTMFEVLYGTGIRRLELINLAVHDIDLQRAALLVREGKGRKDRWLPIGERALHWLKRYCHNARDQLLTSLDESHLFLTDYGEPWVKNRLSGMVKKYLYHAGIDKPGACHLFRHAMATHMLDNGADIRFIQAMLGHADISSTQIYTHVSIEKLREIHAATHPAKLESKEKLLALLQLESDEDADN